MLLGAVFATVGQMTLTYAFSHHRAASVAPYSYVTVALGGLIGWIAWDEVPDWLSLAGAVLVVGGCLIMLRRPKQPDAWHVSAAARDSP